MSASPSCGAGQHSTCPGYYKAAHPCGCPCHQLPASAVAVHNQLRAVEDILAELPAQIEAALTANAFRAGAITAHVVRVARQLTAIHDQVDGR